MNAIRMWWRIFLVLGRQARGRWFVLRDEPLDVVVKLIALTANMKEQWAQHLNEQASEELQSRLSVLIRAAVALDEASASSGNGVA